MQKSFVLIAVLLAATLSYAQRPAGLSVYTWTREDIFAGLIAGDFEQLNAGMKSWMKSWGRIRMIRMLLP